MSKAKIAQIAIIAIVAGGGVPFINMIGIGHCFSNIPFYKQTILTITIECGLYLILSWIVGTVARIVSPSVFINQDEGTSMFR